VPDGGSGKEGRGTVLVVGGSNEIPGAVILAATAALRAGAGKLQIATSREVAPWVAVTMPEARVIGMRQTASGGFHARAADALHADLSQCNAMLLGPGMPACVATETLFATFVGAERSRGARPGATLVVDAGALEAVGHHAAGARAAVRVPVIATPHAGEMARMCGLSRERIAASPLAIAAEYAHRHGVIVVLKGERTYVVAPDGTSFHNTAGNGGLGTSGSGDVLSGIIAGLCARGAPPIQAAVWGVFLHAKAGEALARRMGRLGYLARELPGEIPGLMHHLSR
jgi:ADP-dependent NAD(P)H-hydrate dehydratase